MKQRSLMCLLLSLLMGLTVACKAHAPDPAPPDTPAPGLEDGWGELRMNSLPWANLVIDGKPEGRSGKPIHLPAGVHNLALITTDGRRHKMSITIESGQVLQRCWSCDLNQPCQR